MLTANPAEYSNFDLPRQVARSAKQGNPVSLGDNLPCERVKVG